MKIQVHRNLGAGWPRLIEGVVSDVDDRIGAQIVAAGLGIQLADDQPQVPAVELKTVPPPAEFNTAPEIDQTPIVTEPESVPPPAESNAAPEIELTPIVNEPEIVAPPVEAITEPVIEPTPIVNEPENTKEPSDDAEKSRRRRGHKEPRT